MCKRLQLGGKETSMTKAGLKDYRLGWVGTGRMGYAMASRLLKSGCDVTVCNRTRAKAEPLAKAGATIADSPADLADRDIVFTMVSGPDDLIEVVTGSKGVLSRSNGAQASGRLLERIDRGFSRGPRTGCGSWRRDAGGTGIRQRQGGQGRSAVGGSLGPRSAVQDG